MHDPSTRKLDERELECIQRFQQKLTFWLDQHMASVEELHEEIEKVAQMDPDALAQVVNDDHFARLIILMAATITTFRLERSLWTAIETGEIPENLAHLDIEDDDAECWKNGGGDQKE